jgi:hypothetical protein
MESEGTDLRFLNREVNKVMCSPSHFNASPPELLLLWTGGLLCPTIGLEAVEKGRKVLLH